MTDNSSEHSSMIVELGSSHSRSMSPDTRIKIDHPAEHRVSSTSDADSEDIIIHHSPLRDHTSLDEDPVISNELKDQPAPYRSPSPPSLPPLTTKNLSTGAWAWALRRASETHGHIGQKRSRSQDSDELGGQEEGRENSAKRSKSTAEFWDRNRNQGRQQARLLEISTIPKIAAVTRQDLPPRSSQPDRPTLQPPRKRSLSPIRPLPLNPNSRQIPIDSTTPKRRPTSPITPLLLPHHSTPTPTLQLRHPDLHRRGLSHNPTRYSSVPLSPLFGPRPRIPAPVVRQGSYDDRIAEVVARERCRAQAEQARGQARGPGLPAFWRHEDEQQRLIARAAELEAYNDMQRTRERMSGMIGQRMRPVIAVGPIGGKGMNMEIVSPTTSQSSGARRRGKSVCFSRDDDHADLDEWTTIN